MKLVGFIIFAALTMAASAVRSDALTVDEIIKLKQAGIADSTIELLIKRGGDARSAGVWKQNGWIVHSTESRFPDEPRIDDYYGEYPIDVYPQIYGGRRHRIR